MRDSSISAATVPARRVEGGAITLDRPSLAIGGVVQQYFFDEQSAHKKRRRGCDCFQAFSVYWFIQQYFSVSSRTEQHYHGNGVVISRITLTCLMTVETQLTFPICG